MFYSDLPFNEKQKLQKCHKIESNKENDVFHCEVQTPIGKVYRVRVVIGCDCHLGSNYGLNKRKLCSHEITALQELIRQSQNYKTPKQQKKFDNTFRGENWDTIRLKVLSRDKLTCQSCGKGKCALDVHHIIPYRESKDNNLYNLTTLCKKCHKHEDNYYTQFKKPSQKMCRLVSKNI